MKAGANLHRDYIETCTLDPESEPPFAVAFTSPFPDVCYAMHSRGGTCIVRVALETDSECQSKILFAAKA
jgi:hypothetical protein